jgi:hypothetical protein
LHTPNKILQIKRAEGDAESKYLTGFGIAQHSTASGHYRWAKGQCAAVLALISL